MVNVRNRLKPLIPDLNRRRRTFGSTAAVARALQAPILLVVNAARMGRSVAALVHGYQTFEPDTPIAGVILNNVARGRHEAKLRRAIEHHCGIPVLGALPATRRSPSPTATWAWCRAGEDAGLLPALAACRAAAERYLDLDAILAIAARRCRLTIERHRRTAADTKTRHIAASSVSVTRSPRRLPRPRLHLLLPGKPGGAGGGRRGVGLRGCVPGCGACRPWTRSYIGGGFPEIFMDELSANAALRASVKAAAEAGLPIYAECGGLMYLSRRIIWGERAAEMAGVLPCDVEMTGRPQGHGYVEAWWMPTTRFSHVGTVLRGHEFHNSRLIVTGTCGL